MSEATQCNYCTLKSMRRAAKKAGAPLIQVRNGTGDWSGWKVLYQDGKPLEHYMREISDHCEC